LSRVTPSLGQAKSI